MDSEMSSQSNWRGVPVSEIVGSNSPWGAPEFPLIRPSSHHAVLYHIPSDGSWNGDRPPRPQVGQDKWDSEYVRMPCSPKSLYPVENSNGEKHLTKRWVMIEKALRQPIRNSQGLADAILSYNTKFKTIWKFRALHSLFNEHLDEDESEYFFTVTLPEIAKLALDLPKLIQAPIPLLKQHSNRSLSLTQLQIASLLANAFFCTFPRRNTAKKASEYASYPHINFSSLYECSGADDVLEKLKCICHYFRRVCTKAPVGVMTFTRRGVRPKALPAWPKSLALIASLPVHVDPASTIEDADGLIQVDFANKYLGGGVLGHGSVQEEIRFVICPELMVSMLFTEVLRPNEALLMIGSERYSKYLGYSRTFQWAGDFSDVTPLDSSGRRRSAVLAIDAHPYSSRVHEYRREMLVRELNKAWVGVSFYTDDSPSLQYPGLATGNWGCGAFGGSPQLKSLVQMMACAHARRPMAYYTFRDNQLRDEIMDAYNMLARYNVTVGQLFQYIVRFSTTDVRRSNLHAFLQQTLIDEEKSKNKSGPMDITPPVTTDQYENNDSIQEILLNNSPDLFSQDEVRSQEGSDTNVNKHTDTSKIDECNSSKSDTISNENKMSIDDHKMAPNQISGLFDECHSNKSDTISNENKMAVDDHKMAPNQTSRLFDEMQKFDEDNCKLTSIISTDNKAHNRTFPLFNEQKNTISRQSNELQKPIEDNSVSFVSHTPHTPTNLSKKSDTRSPMDCDRSEMSSEVKKKMARKITDYFTKKSI